jgi:hypothetical protein
VTIVAVEEVSWSLEQFEQVEEGQEEAEEAGRFGFKRLE